MLISNRILIIDNDKENAYALKKAIESALHNCEILYIKDSEKIAAVCIKDKIDLILFDMHLPEAMNFKVVNLLKSKSETKNIPIIFIVSGSILKKFKEKDFDIGTIDYITKPFEATQLINKIKLYIDLLDREKELIKNEEKFRELFNNMIGVSAIFKVVNNGEDFIFTDFNKTGEKIEKINRKDIIGKSISEVYPLIKEKNLLSKFKEVWKTGIPQKYSFFHFDENDKLVFWKNGYLYKLSSGELVSIYNDITKRKRIEEDLLISEVKHWFLLESIDSPVIAVKKNMNILYCNKEYAKLFNKSIIELEKKNLLSVIPEFKTTKSYKVFQKALEIDDMQEIEIKIKNECFIERVYKTPWGVISVLNNITMRKKIEGEIKKLSFAVEESPIGILITDSNGVIEYVNSTYIKQSGYTLKEMKDISRNIINLKSDNIEYYKKIWEKISKGKEWKSEMHNHKKNGEMYWESILISPIKNKTGEVTNYVIIAEDITNRKMYESGIEKLNEELENRVTERTNLLKNAYNELDEKNKQLDFRNKIMEYDLKLAQKVQQQLLTEYLPTNDEYEFYTLYQPMDAVGGDFYEFTKRREGDIGVLICDVSGHGVAASLITSMVKIISNTNRRYAHKPALYLKGFNKGLYNKTADNFVAAFYGVLIPKIKIFKYSNAGHIYPIIYRNKEDKIYKIMAKGGVMGVTADLNFEEHEMTLESGDIIIFFTDGLTDALNKEKEKYGRDRFYDYIYKNKNRNLKDIIDGLYNDLNEFRGKIVTDDVAMIGIKVKKF